MLYSNVDVLAFAIASVAVALDIYSLSTRSGAELEFWMGTKRRRRRGGCGDRYLLPEEATFYNILRAFEQA